MIDWLPARKQPIKLLVGLLTKLLTLTTTKKFPSQNVKDGRLVGDHLLQVGGRVLGLVGRVQEHLLHVVVPDMR